MTPTTTPFLVTIIGLRSHDLPIANPHFIILYQEVIVHFRKH